MSDPLSAALAKAAEELEWQQGAVRSGDYDAAARVVIAASLRAWPDQMLDGRRPPSGAGNGHSVRTI